MQLIITNSKEITLNNVLLVIFMQIFLIKDLRWKIHRDDCEMYKKHFECVITLSFFFKFDFGFIML